MTKPKKKKPVGYVVEEKDAMGISCFRSLKDARKMVKKIEGYGSVAKIYALMEVER